MSSEKIYGPITMDAIHGKAISVTDRNRRWLDGVSLVNQNGFVNIDLTKDKVPTMTDKYPKYYKPIPKDWNSIDVYGVCRLFPVDDPTGAINHARKKLLVPGTRTGGKSFRDDIKEARDTLTRYLELTEPDAVKEESFNDKRVCGIGSAKE